MVFNFPSCLYIFDFRQLALGVLRLAGLTIDGAEPKIATRWGVDFGRMLERASALSTRLATHYRFQF